jgi:hypothetical protein
MHNDAQTGYRIEDNIYSGQTERYGMSLFAKCDFQKDDLVFVAFGPITIVPTKFTIPIDDEFKIDPTRPEGNICQYVCHSCDPNLGIKDRSCFVAFRDIKKGEEVVVDYAMFGYEYGDEISEDERKCLCGSSICRGKLGCYKELPDVLREKYRGYISDYLIQKSPR